MKRSRINPTNPGRRAETYAKAYGDKATWIRAQPCCVPGCNRHPSVAAHAIARGMGAAKGDASRLLPMCQACHVAAGEYRTTDRREFEQRHGMGDGEALVQLAAGYDERWESGADYGAPF
jgi:cytochrome c553